MCFPYCWPLAVPQGWEALKGRLLLAVISGAAGVCWAWPFRTGTRGTGSQIWVGMFRRCREQFPRQPSQFAPAFIPRTLPGTEEPAAFLIQHRAVCLQPRVAEGPKACSCFSSELFYPKACLLPVLPTALLVIVTTTRSNPAVISSKHLLPMVCFSFLLEYLGLTEP